MFYSHLVTYPQAEAGGSYGENLGRAARAFLAALMAVQPARAQAPANQVSKAERQRTVNVMKLYRLAGSYDTVSPSLIAELRSIAKRG